MSISRIVIFGYFHNNWLINIITFSKVENLSTSKSVLFLFSLRYLASIVPNFSNLPSLVKFYFLFIYYPISMPLKSDQDGQQGELIFSLLIFNTAECKSLLHKRNFISNITQNKRLHVAELSNEKMTTT